LIQIYEVLTAVRGSFCAGSLDPNYQIYFAGNKDQPVLTDIREEVQAHWMLMTYSKHNETYNFKDFEVWPENE
jgi:hypothetical protein